MSYKIAGVEWNDNGTIQCLRNDLVQEYVDALKTIDRLNKTLTAEEITKARNEFYNLCSKTF